MLACRGVTERNRKWSVTVFAVPFVVYIAPDAVVLSADAMTVW
jgi:hypothetical protein